MRNEIKQKLIALLAIKEDEFINVDIANFNGVVIIQLANIRYKEIMSKIVDIDSILGETLEADILDTMINISYPLVDDTNALRVVIHFSFEN